MGTKLTALRNPKFSCGKQEFSLIISAFDVIRNLNLNALDEINTL